MTLIRQKAIALVVMGILVASNSVAAEAAKNSVLSDSRQPVDLVIALDVSGSMSDLIDSTKQRLWDVVNELAQANPQPDLRMAILTYGRPSYGEQSGYVRIDLPFTRDLDAVNRTLFSFSTDGGDEYVSRVVHRAVTDLKWNADPLALKMLFVAGNEAADQDPLITSHAAAQLAADHGIVVNTIYCGDANDGLVAGWQAFSTHTNGMFASIDQAASAVANVATPMDDQLVKLNKELNETYVAFGQEGSAYKANQVEQDQNTGAMSAPSLVSRTITKVGKLYDNAKWDLVDAIESGRSVEEMETADLPEPMRTMSQDERSDYVAELAEKRAEVRAKIESLGQARQAYIAEERARRADHDEVGLDKAMIDGIRSLAKKKGFEFE